MLESSLDKDEQSTDMDQNQDPIKLDLPADFVYIYLVHIGVKSSAGFRCWVEATHGSSACRWKCGGDEESAGCNWSILILHSVYVSPVRHVREARCL